MRKILVLLLLLSVLGAGAAGAHNSAAVQPDISFVPYASGLEQPVDIANSGIAGDERLFVVEQPGQIRVVEAGGDVLPTSFLNITDRVNFGGEKGLLGLVFHPDYASNDYFYVNYTSSQGAPLHSRISRFEVTDNPNVADPASECILLTVPQPFSNHNAGDLAFGPDGYLYIPFGDGGGAGDTGNRAQDPQELLGKMLRIDVNVPDNPATGCPDNYAIPPDNPFVDDPATRDEIWALGLRNPWRISFDRLTNALFIADVGQSEWEEINVEPPGSPGGRNWGWRCYEGRHPFNLSGCGPADQYDFPIFEYDHSGGACAVIGGFVYRGADFPALYGHYLFADNCSSQIASLALDGGLQAYNLGLTPTNPSSFGEDIGGELYMAGLFDGVIYRIVETTPPMHVAAINVGYRQAGNAYEAGARIFIADADGSAVAGAVVTTEITTPDGSTRAINLTTNASGIAQGAGTTDQTGIYTICVTDVVKDGFVYDPAANTETCESLTIP